jgi:hypothetical protein
VLVALEGDVEKTLGSIKKGIALLDERRASLDGAGPAPEETEDAEAWEEEAPEPTTSRR